jgi:Tfp pilus assembly protein PilF
LARDSTVDHATLRLIHQTAQAGNRGEAVVLAEAALADGLEHPLLFNLVALKLEEQGQLLDAAALLERAVVIAPSDIGVRNALGLVWLRLDRPADALMQFTALLRLNASLPFAHASLGNTFFALGLIAEAEASYRQALQLDANHGVALAGLAHLASSRGAYADARAWAQSSRPPIWVSGAWRQPRRGFAACSRTAA